MHKPDRLTCAFMRAATVAAALAPAMAGAMLFAMLVPTSALLAWQDDQQRDELFERSLQELFDTSRGVSDEVGADQPMTFSGHDEPRWLQGLTVTRSDNPMLEQQCREQALAGNTRRLQDEGRYASDEETLHATVEHMHMHHEFIRDHRISYADYLQSLVECEEFCAPLVASLMQCHVLSVARKPHGIVLFPIDSSRVDTGYRDGVIDEMARQYRENPDSSIVLIGRASQIGNLTYNRRLAAQRALAVRDELTGAGVPFEKIRPIWFGWEPPQLDQSIAEEYGIADLYRERGKDELNQSVVMVIF